MSNMLDWAKREVEIACKKENPNRKEGEFDYGCACYESAIKALVDDKVDYSYLTTMPESTEQTNSIMLDLILRKYSRKYRRFKRQQKKGE